MTTEALLDSKVLVAIIVSGHPDHLPSGALFDPRPAGRYALATHSFAEAYVTLTRRGSAGWCQLDAAEAWAALESLRSRMRLVGLTPAQILDTIRHYATEGGIGARIYDALIGETAVLHGIPAIITWNTRHLAGLFPFLAVATPSEFLSRHSA